MTAVAAAAAASPPVSLQDLLRSAGPVDWLSVLNRTSSHPHEACTKRGGLIHRGRARYPLQLALTRFRDSPAPLEVIRQLIDAHPRAVFCRDEIGNSPLYYATIHASKDVVQMLLDANPAAASLPEKYYEKLPIHVAREKEVGLILIKAHPQGVATRCHLGQLPLHRACLNRDASSEFCRLLVEEGKKQGIGGSQGRGGAFVSDLCGKTPVDYLADKIAHAEKWRKGNNMDCGATSTPATVHLWQKFSVLAAAVLPPMHCQSPSTDRILTLHAAIELGCSTKLIKLAMQNRPNEVTALDCLGRSCLAIAASNKKTSQAVIDMLTHAFASLGCVDILCIADRDGKLPLHHAASSGRAYDSAMHAILVSNPSALMTRDGTGHFPVMLAAIDGNSDLNVVYNLLKETPAVVSMQ